MMLQAPFASRLGGSPRCRPTAPQARSRGSSRLPQLGRRARQQQQRPGLSRATGSDDRGPPPSIAPQPRAPLFEVPLDLWTFVQVTAGVWVVDQAIPAAALSTAAALQGAPAVADLPLVERELLGLACQLLQLAATYAILSRALQPHQPLPRPWFLLEPGAVPLLQGLATAIVGVGSGVLLSGLLTGAVDGSEEWRHLAGLHADARGTAALVLGAVVLAPVLEEGFFRGFVLPCLTKWAPAPVAVALTAALFASAHPAEAFLPEALLGGVLSLSLLVADGNLLVPLLGHCLYNCFVLGAEFLL